MILEIHHCIIFIIIILINRYYACLCGHYEVAEYIIKKGGKDDKVSRSYWNSLTLEVKIFYNFYKHNS
jgi:hypothetical protein